MRKFKVGDKVVINFGLYKNYTGNITRLSGNNHYLIKLDNDGGIAMHSEEDLLPYVDKPTFNFAEALNRLESGMSVTCKRWAKGIIVSLFREPYKVLVLEDTNRKTTVTFVPSNENMFDDEWEEVENE